MKTRTLNHRIRLASLALVAGTGLAAGSMAHAQDQGTVNLAYVEWSSEVASTNVIAAVLEQVGFEVELTSLSAAAMFQALSTGDADAIVAAWLVRDGGGWSHWHCLLVLRDELGIWE